MSARQMERDGIRSLSRMARLREGCGYVLNPGDCIEVRCHKGARYATSAGLRCFEHARSTFNDSDNQREEGK